MTRPTRRTVPLRVLTGSGTNLRLPDRPLESPGTPAAPRTRELGDEPVPPGLSEDGDLPPEIAGYLRLLHLAETSIAIFAEDADGRWIARAASDGHHAVLAEQLGDELVLTELPVPGWSRIPAALLPSLQPAAGEPVSTAEGFSGPEKPLPNVAHLPTSPGPTPVSRVAEVYAAPRLGSGHFVITTTDRPTDRATDSTLSWVHTEGGAYAATAAPDPDGTPRTTYVPIDNLELGRLLGHCAEVDEPVPG